jgi:hypothetical protein
MMASCTKKKTPLPSGLFKTRTFRTVEYKYVQMYPMIVDTVISEQMGAVTPVDDNHVVFGGRNLYLQSWDKETIRFSGEHISPAESCGLTYYLQKDSVSFGERVTSLYDTYIFSL